MRFSAIYVDSMRKWAVIDTLSDNFAVAMFDDRRAAQSAAEAEEDHWAELFAEVTRAVG